MLVNMTLNKILSIINTLVSLDMHDNFIKKIALGIVWKKNLPSMEKENRFSTESYLKMSIFYRIQNFFQFCQLPKKKKIFF